MAFNNSALIRDNSIQNGVDSLLNSYDDGEESFVVLERSTANDFNGGLERSSLSQSFHTNQDDNSFSVFHKNLPKAMSNSFSNQIQENTLPAENLDCSVATSVSAEEIDKRLKEVLHENIILKENLRQTNLAMKQQLSTVSLVQDRALEAQKKQQLKFEETKALILKMGSEKTELVEANEALTQEINKLKEDNKELNKTNFAFGEETSKLVSENAILKSQLAALQDSMKIMSETNRRTSLQPTAKEVELRDTVEQLSRKLEAVERARRQLEFDIDRLQAQLGRASLELVETQRKLAHTENALQRAESVPKSEPTSIQPVLYLEKLLAYETLLNDLKSTFDYDQSNMNSWASMTEPSGSSTQFEVSELRRLLSQEQCQSVARKENLYKAASAIQDMLGDIKNLGQELELLKADTAVRESHSMEYEEMKKKGYTEKIDELTAVLVQREEALAIAERHLASLQEAVRLHHQDKQGQDGGSTQGLKEEIEHLTKQIKELKEQKIKENEEEINALRTELQKLQETKDTVAVFEEQAKIYQADFETERMAREALVAEKDRILEDLRHLQRRNEDLFVELNKTRDELNVLKAGRRELPAAAAQMRPGLVQLNPQHVQPSAPSRPVLVCPISTCKQSFDSQNELNKHMFVCWGNQYTSTFSLPRKSKYGCNYEGCKLSFKSKDEYTLHLKFQHSDDNPQVRQSKWFCLNCGMTFSNKKEHAQHLSICAVNKDGPQTIKNANPCAVKEPEQAHVYCPNCDYPFENEESLTHHVIACWGIED